MIRFSKAYKVSTHSRPKAAGAKQISRILPYPVSTHSRPKAAGAATEYSLYAGSVSTHSRPKAAGSGCKPCGTVLQSFNTQPPEGGWLFWSDLGAGWDDVSTHSRPKAAGSISGQRNVSERAFQHTAARRRLGTIWRNVGKVIDVSTHSRPKAAGQAKAAAFKSISGFNTQPPEGGWLQQSLPIIPWMGGFQHTAARRRLVHVPAKVQARFVGFNTQPPEGGWSRQQGQRYARQSFNTQPPEGGWRQTPIDT